MMQLPSKEYGITLIELLITLSISSILFLFASSSHQSIQVALQEEFLKYEFTQQLRMAKNLASIENRAITLCGTLDGKTCIDAKNQKWHGWLLFYDDQASFQPQEELIIHQKPISLLFDKGFHIKTTINIGGGINFKARRQYAYGMARSIANGRIQICKNETNDKGFDFIINVYGYFRTEKGKDAC